MKRILVLGAGLVGSAMIKDLCQDSNFSILAADMDHGRLDSLGRQERLETIVVDASRPENLTPLFDSVDLVLNAMPGHLGFSIVKHGILAHKDMVDIAFSPEDPLSLHKLAEEYGCTVITDMGVAPGMSNLLAGHAASLMDSIDELKIVVGGLPQQRTWPFEYKAVFSPIDVLEEYTRPARFIVNHTLVSRPALSDQELIDLPNVGTLEAFNSDGLRSLLTSIRARNMVEKTLRYPGHARLMEVFKHSGFFNTKPIMIGGQKVVPLSLTSALLFEQWKLQDGEADLTVMQVKARGYLGDTLVHYQADLYDTYDPESEIHSMARTTGYAATAALRLLAREQNIPKGIILPEILGMNQYYRQFLLDDQKKRGIHYDISIV